MNPSKRQQEWMAITEFYDLLYVRKSNVEGDYQDLFERFPVIFEAIGIAEYKALAKKDSPYSLAFDKRLGYAGTTPEPDFVGIKRHSKLVTVIEIKTPMLENIVRSRSDGNRNRPMAGISEGVAQLNEYISSIVRVEESSDRVCEWFGLPKLTECQGIFVAGLRSEQTKSGSDELFLRNENRIRHLYFDDVFEALCRAHLGGDDASQPGMAMVSRVVIPQLQIHQRPTLASWGTSSEAMLELFIEGNRLVLQHSDANGYTARLFHVHTPDVPLTIRVEAGLGEDDFWMLLNVNNQPAQTLTSHERLQPVDLTVSKIGCALDVTNHARFYQLDIMLFDRTLTVAERLKLWSWSRNRVLGNGHLYFDGTAFLESPSSS